MIAFLKRYKPFLIGFLITYVLAYTLQYVDLILIDDSDIGEKVLGFLIYWLPISLAIRNYLLHQGKLYHVILTFAFFFLLFITVGAYTKDMRDNPVMLVSVVAFWFGIFYFILPTFFKKYRVLLFLTYGFTCLYFIYVRTFADNFESYSQQDKPLALSLFLIPIPVFTILWIYEQWKWFRSLQAEKTEVELALLKTQVNPHFLFNTLNNLYSLTVQKSEQAPDVVLKLSDMMRYTIYEGKKDLVLLSSEIRYLEDYIELQKIRYKKKVDIQFVNDLNNDLQIAPLLFIILVENAFKHGVEKLRTDAFIHIHLTTINEEVHFSIENNFDPEEIGTEQGIGLTNLKSRLALTYPNKHQIKMTQIGNNYHVQLNIATK